jgi:predicted CopG family antitoxin
VVANVWERLVVSKQDAQTFDDVVFNLRKLNELEVRKQNQIEFTNRFAAVENLSDGEDINRSWENIKMNIKTSAIGSLSLHEFKQHKPCFDEECLGFFYIKESRLRCSGSRIQARAV